MLTFIENVKRAIKRREGFEKHKMMPVKKLIFRDNYEQMFLFLKEISTRNEKAQLKSIESLGAVLYFPIKKSKRVAVDIKNQGIKLKVSQILHVEYREEGQAVYACLEDL